MGARNTFTPSFGNRSADMENEMYEEFTTVSCHICNKLFSDDEDGFETRRMTWLYKLYGRYEDPERKLQPLRAHSYAGIWSFNF